MREPDWFDGPERDDEGPSAARRRWLLPLIAVPWLAVAALLVLPGRTQAPAQAPADDQDRASEVAPIAGHGEAAPSDGARPRDEPEPADPVPGPAASDESAAAGPAPPPTAVLELEELRGGWRVAPGEGETAALAVVVARAWLTGLGPRLTLAGASPAEDQYAEHLVVEAIEHPSRQTSVVTVLAVLLSDPEGADASVEVRRLAVPLATGDGAPRPAGAPWLLPGPELEAVETELVPLEDPAARAAADTALAIAGLGEMTIDELRTAEGWPVVATASDGEVERTIWLRRHLDGFVVAGSTLAGAPVEDRR